jgi:hypothetical protein
LFVFLFPYPACTETALGEAAKLTRSFDELFPDIDKTRKKEAFGPDGLVYSKRINENLEFIPAAGSGIDLLTMIMKTNPSYITESLLVVPYEEKLFSRLDAYNSLGKVSDLKGRLYRSHTRNAEVPLFEDATRIESAQKNNPVPDPQPATELPRSETVFLRLKDVNFGNSFYRGDISVSQNGIIYSLTNFKNLSYLFFPVIKEEKFAAVLYMEPLDEGLLVYGMAGADASDFVANRIDIPSAINKRLAVFIGWIRDGLIAAR